MKNKILVVLVLVALVAAYKVFKAVQVIQHGKVSGGPRIAIFTPTTHPALEEIEQGFKETLQALDNAGYSFKVFNANGNKTLLRAQAEDIVTGKYALIVTIGVACGQTMVELLAKKDIQTPHVFTAVDGLELAQSLKDSNPSSTGVYSTTDYTTQIELLYKLKPETKTILLVYDPTHGVGLEAHKEHIANSSKQLGITLRSVEVYQANEIQQKVAGLLSGVDVVLVLTDNTVVAGIDALVTLCNRYGVTLLASDLASGKKGAALAYGVTEYASGEVAAQVAHEILVDHKNPQELPLRAVDGYTLELNTETMRAQGLDLTQEQIDTVVAGICS